MDAKTKLEKFSRVARLRTKFCPVLGETAELSVGGGHARREGGRDLLLEIDLVFTQ